MTVPYTTNKQKQQQTRQLCGQIKTEQRFVFSSSGQRCNVTSSSWMQHWGGPWCAAEQGTSPAVDINGDEPNIRPPSRCAVVIAEQIGRRASELNSQRCSVAFTDTRQSGKSQLRFAFFIHHLVISRKKHFRGHFVRRMQLKPSKWPCCTAAFEGCSPWTGAQLKSLCCII